MKQLVLVCIIVLCISASQLPYRVRNTNVVFTESSFSDKQVIFSTSSVWFNDEANKENCQQSGPRLFSTKQKFINGKTLTGRVSELSKNSKITNYILISEYHIKRLEGNDIIHPFNYFW